MKPNYPTNQISPEKRWVLAAHTYVLSKRLGISEDICKEAVRVGYEAGWNDALETADATPFSRLK